MTHLSGVDEETANMVRDLFLEEDKVAVKERPKKKIRKAKEDTESIDKNANKAKKNAYKVQDLIELGDLTHTELCLRDLETKEVIMTFKKSDLEIGND